MKEAERQQFAQLLTDVLAYYRQTVSEFTMSVWWEAMGPYTFEQVSKAMSAHAKNPDGGQFAPKVADLIRILEGTHGDRAMLAWGKVHEAMSAVGAYQDVVFDDPAIHAVVEDLGGWPKLCRTETRELGYVQKRFCDSHKAYTGRGTFPYPRRLMGDRSPDHEWETKGLPLPRPALVGDAERAALVFQGGTAAGKTAIEFSDPVAVLETSNVLKRISA